MSTLTTIVVVLVVLVLVGLALSVRIVQQYEEGVLFAWAGSSGSESPA
jgi:regulator of protease activity HflC (stomatin/prohibitin superfamily)